MKASNFKNSLYGVLGFIFPLTITLFTTPYIVNRLTIEIYGIYILSTSLMGLMSFMDLGFGQGIIKFVSELEAKKDFEGIKNIVGVSFYIHLVMGIVGAFIIFTFTDKLVFLFKVNENYTNLARFIFQLTALGFFINFITNTFSSIPAALQRYDISTKVQITTYLLLTLSILALLYLGYGLKEVITASLIVSFLKLLISFFIYRKILPYIPFKPVFNLDIFKKIFSFSFFTAINSITGNLVFKLDKMIISSFLGTSAVTYYAIPFMMVQMGFSLITSATQFMFPATSNLSSLGLKEELKRIYMKLLRYTFVMSSILTAGFIILGGVFLTIWMGADFAKTSEKLIPIISIVFFFQSISVPAFYVYNGLGLSKINMISSLVGSGAYLLAALILIPALNLIGAALAFAFTLLPFIFYFHYMHRVVGVKNKGFLILGLKSFSTIIVNYMLFYIINQTVYIQSSIINFIFIGTVLLILSFTMIYFFRLVKIEDVKSLLDRLNYKSFL